MWQMYARVASDLIDDRYREAQAAALRHAAAGNPRRAARSLGVARRVPAWTLRRLEAAASGVAHRAQLAAGWLEQPSTEVSDPAC
jgi:hypothetical protein